MLSFDQQLKSVIIRHEGNRNFPYIDTKNNITIGIGYNLSSRGLSDEWINQQYERDVKYFYHRLDKDFYWFKNLTDARKIVLIDMCFMGYRKFLTFNKLFAALKEGDYLKAAKEIMNSEWAEEVKGRAKEDYDLMLSGDFQSWEYSTSLASEMPSQSP